MQESDPSRVPLLFPRTWVTVDDSDEWGKSDDDHTAKFLQNSYDGRPRFTIAECTQAIQFRMLRHEGRWHTKVKSFSPRVKKRKYGHGNRWPPATCSANELCRVWLQPTMRGVRLGERHG